MQHDCLKLSPIVRKCKFKITETAANNVINKEGESAFTPPFIHEEVGDFDRLAQEVIPPVRKPNGRMWKRASGQVAAQSLEWIRRWGS